MYTSTAKMPPALQHKIKRNVFRIVSDAEETLLSMSPYPQSHSSHSSYGPTSRACIWHHWSIAFRAGTLLRGHHTNNFCESTMCIIKDIVLSRCKAYNTAQLLMFIVEIFDVYMRERLVDVALSRRHVKPIISTKVALDSVELVGNSKYKVQSESDPTIKYDVDPEIGLCSCMQGQTGAICKHQIACAKFSMTAVPQQFLSSSESRHRLAVMAVGQEKVPDVASFRKLNEDGGFEITGKAEIKEIDSEKTENLDMEEKPQDPISRTETMSSSDDDDFASRKISRDVGDAIVRRFGAKDSVAIQEFADYGLQPEL
ncbi:uncharacterized protein LOC135216553 [Macrobrachium nipponense]|uniref:uncharacterized protein LOC135216553 n=1 Tax=Macrobrachium nipponense TaxID=159736 RepID=UPI0030C8B3DF